MTFLLIQTCSSMPLLVMKWFPLCRASVTTTKFEYIMMTHRRRHFKIPYGIFYCMIMSFGLKNDGATYQRVMPASFYDMLYEYLKDYVDDVLVKP